MRLGIIADIHGNLPALRAVLSAMPAVDLVLCAGDVVGYYPDVNEVCELLRATGVYVIRGNHDAYVVGELAPDPARRDAYRTDWTRERLTSVNFSWLASLPLETRFRFKRTEIVIRHASPWDEETYLYPDSKKLAEIVPEIGNILIFGHTHHPLRRTVGQGLVLNPGSVGQPRDYNQAAAYAMIDTTSFDPVFMRAAYDVSAYQRQLRDQGWDEAMIKILSRKKD